MDRYTTVNQWNRVDLRKTLCIACNGRLRLPCPKCEGQNTNDRCWAQLDKNQDYRHHHCAGLQKGNKN